MDRSQDRLSVRRNLPIAGLLLAVFVIAAIGAGAAFARAGAADLNGVGAENLPNRPATTGTPTSTPSPTSIPGQSCPDAYQDLMPGDPNFPFAHCVTCDGIMESFACGYEEPCVPPNNYPYFRPNVGFSATYAEVAKTLAQAAGFNDPPSGQLFEDIPPNHPYYAYIQRMGERNLMLGFPCGGPGEPCVPPGNLPYFRPDSHDETRGKFAHHLSDTAGFNEF